MADDQARTLIERLISEEKWSSLYQHERDLLVTFLAAFDAQQGDYKYATGELTAIDSLVDGRQEVGTYQRVEAALQALSARVEQAEQEQAKLKRQAEGQCDTCGELLDDAMCVKCVAKSYADGQRAMLAQVKLVLKNRRLDINKYWAELGSRRGRLAENENMLEMFSDESWNALADAPQEMPQTEEQT